MDLLRGPVRPIYWKYLAAAFGSTLISSIYSIVDMAVVGQYQGPSGAAALAVVAPVWNVIYSLGLLTGIGGSVIFSTKRGSGRADGSDSQYFTAALIGSGILAALAWVGLSMAAPNLYVRLFMKATPEVLALAPGIIRRYALSFLLLPFNIFSTYYFQSIFRQGAALTVSLCRGLAVSGALIFLLPALLGAQALWFAMPVTELITAAYAAMAIRRYTQALPEAA